MATSFGNFDEQITTVSWELCDFPYRELAIQRWGSFLLGAGRKWDKAVGVRQGMSDRERFEKCENCGAPDFAIVSLVNASSGQVIQIFEKDENMSLIGGMLKAMCEISSLNDIQSWAVSSVRGPMGLIVISENRQSPPRPEEPLELFGFEACPYCRKVREALTVLDLSYISRTGTGGSPTAPYLVDANKERSLSESEDIITYLSETYGPGRKGLAKALASANTAGSKVASTLRSRGRRIRTGFEERAQPEEMLVLYNIEASPYCRKVRETLTELNLDARVENVGKFSARRPELLKAGGRMMVPFFIDPNRDVEIYESDNIVEYLEKYYGT